MHTIKDAKFNKKFYFAKLNINENIFSENLEELIEVNIPKAIEEAKEITILDTRKLRTTEKPSTISFTDLFKEDFNGTEFLIGNLTRSITQIATVREDDVTRKIEVNEPTVDTATFIYDIKNEVLAFSKGTYISENQFIEYFKELIQLDVTLGEIEIILYPNFNELETILSKNPDIEKVIFRLIQPNPPRGKDYNRYKELSKDMHAPKIDIIYKDPKGRLKIIKDDGEYTDSAKDGLELVQSGYGEVEINGQQSKGKGKEPFTFNSSETNTNITTKSNNFEDLLKAVYNKIQKLIRK